MRDLTAAVLLAAAGICVAAAAEGSQKIPTSALGIALLGTSSPADTGGSSVAGTAATVGGVIGAIALVAVKLLIRRAVSAPTQPRTRRRGTFGETGARRLTGRKR